MQKAATAAKPQFTATHSDHINRRDFARLARFIYDYSGIKMPETKITMLEGRLRRRVRARNLHSFDAYCHFLFEEGGLETEAPHLIDVVTTNKTDFFREPGHFKYMLDHALPEFARSGTSKLRIWSSACSTGAEPYTIAMVMEDFIAAGNRMDYSILATDLSNDVLQTALNGVYHRDIVAPVPPASRSRYVMQHRDKLKTDVRIHPRLRSKVAFGRMNLMDDRYSVGDPMHIIFCRNVLIYFDKETQFKVLTRLCDCLLPGGYLFIGHSESITGMDLPVKQVANTVFRKI